MNPEERDLMIRDIRKAYPGGPMGEVRKLLGKKSSDVMNLAGLSDTDLRTVAYNLGAYDQEKRRILGDLQIMIDSALNKGESERALNLRTLARVIERKV
jgi:hypothetical protein